MQYCTFRCERYLFGIDVLQVQEIMRQLRSTRVPLAPPVVIGLINLRGQLVTAFDLRRRLDLPPRDNGSSPVNVVIRRVDGAVALQVDEIGDVVDVSEDCYEKTPETVQGVARDFISGVYKLKDRLLLILDTAKVVDVPCPVVHS
jgi:purine-binding chemotaxis protein CheW